MDEQEMLKILEMVASGTMDKAAAADKLLAGGVSHNLGYARLDMSRQARCGFPEFIFGEEKTPEQVCGIMEALKDRKSVV